MEMTPGRGFHPSLGVRGASGRRHVRHTHVASQGAPAHGHSWEGTVPVAAYQIDVAASTSTHPPAPRFSITELRAIPVPRGDGDQLKIATSSNGKPLYRAYGAYSINSEEQICLQQQFEFTQTAPGAGVFVPLSTSDALEYARYRFSGSIECLPHLLRLQPMSNASSARHQPQPRPQPDLAATSHVGTSNQGAYANARPQLATTDSGTGGAGEEEDRKGKRKLEELKLEGLSDRCHPCFLCTACKSHWGACLPERYFRNARKDIFRLPKEETPFGLKRLDLGAARQQQQLGNWRRGGPRSRRIGYRGIDFYKRTRRWESHIWYNGKNVYIGASPTPELAARIYDKAALALIGPDAYVNFNPRDYEEEYPFLYRLTMKQLLIYLRNESRDDDEEAQYPGVNPVNGIGFAANYRPMRNRAFDVHLGMHPSADLAARAVFSEAIRLSNYEMAGRIMDTHHVRTAM